MLGLKLTMLEKGAPADCFSTKHLSYQYINFNYTDKAVGSYLDNENSYTWKCGLNFETGPLELYFIWIIWYAIIYRWFSVRLQ